MIFNSHQTKGRRARPVDLAARLQEQTKACRNLNEGDNSEDTSICVRVILKWNVE